ncbi:hypothetical protein WISP_76145 [Willisornis vidua]|uniref:RING-type E3 ubiquitin transferase n=1 Tax=Willisornis vidua TaxID=1566151 RepID=A0ABQ9DBD5_9PASS|nr:hypothetical protein WISP_76145 [Willisornis vidua]
MLSTGTWTDDAIQRILAQGNAQYQYSLGNEMIQSSPAKKDLGVLVDERGLRICEGKPGVKLVRKPGLNDSREWSLIRFVENTSLVGTADILAGRVAIQGKVDRLEKRGNRNSMKFKTGKSYIWDKIVPCHNRGTETAVKGSIFEGKRGFWWLILAWLGCGLASCFIGPGHVKTLFSPDSSD